jgi:hypothetical protein
MTDAIRMEVKSSGDCDIGYRGRFVQKEHQLGSLSKMRRRRTSTRESLSLGEKLLREGGTVKRRWSGHGTAPLSEQSL